MILAVTEQYHDYSPEKYYIDTEKLNKNSYIEKMILQECKKKAKIIDVHIDASNWESEPEKFGGDEPGVHADARTKKPKLIDKVLNLTIDFEG
jgi:hypothetical protein